LAFLFIPLIIHHIRFSPFSSLVSSASDFPGYPRKTPNPSSMHFPVLYFSPFQFFPSEFRLQCPDLPGELRAPPNLRSSYRDPASPPSFNHAELSPHESQEINTAKTRSPVPLNRPIFGLTPPEKPLFPPDRFTSPFPTSILHEGPELKGGDPPVAISLFGGLSPHRFLSRDQTSHF